MVMSDSTTVLAEGRTTSDVEASAAVAVRDEAEVLRWWCQHPLTFARSFRGAPWPPGPRAAPPARARPVPCAAPRPGGVRRFRPPPAAPAPPGPGLATGGERFSPRRPPGAPAPASAGGAAPGSGAPAAAVVVAVVAAGGPPWTGGGAPAPAPVPVRSPSPVVFAALMVCTQSQKFVFGCWMFPQAGASLADFFGGGGCSVVRRQKKRLGKPPSLPQIAPRPPPGLFWWKQQSQEWLGSVLIQTAREGWEGGECGRLGAGGG